MNQTRRLSWVWGVCLAIMFVAGPLIAQDAPKPADLRPLWKQGQTSRYETTYARLRTSEVIGLAPPVQAKMKVDAVVRWKVTAANPDGGGVAEMTIENMTVELTNSEGESLTVDRNSNDERTANMAKVLNALIDSPLEVHVDATGHVGQVKGAEAIQAKTGLDDDSGMTEKDFQESASDLAVLVGGAQAVAAGESWNEKFEWNHEMGSISYDTTYTLAGVEPIAGVPVAMINRTAALGFIPDLSDLPEDAPPITAKLVEGSHTAQIMFDLSRHEVVGQNIDQTMQIEVTIEAPGRRIVRVMKEQSNSQLVRISEQ